MLKICAFVVSILLSGGVIAKDVEIKVGEFSFKPIVLSQFEHDAGLFIYDDAAVKIQAMQTPNARAANLNAFLLETGDKKILFDTGVDNSITSKLKDMGVAVEDIDVVILTHMHADHTGGLLAEEKPVFINAKIYVAAEELATNADSLAKYGDQVIGFEQNAKILEGITSIPAFGHTTGQTIYKVESNGETLYIVADLLHAKMQFAYPDIYMTYDSEPANALKIRHIMLDKVSDEKAWIAGMHFTGNGLGKVNKKDGSYEFIAVE